MAGGEVQLVDLVKRFGDFTAVDGLNLKMPPGEFFSLLGPSGCGKTTTLRMIAGFERPDGGSDPPRRRRHGADAAAQAEREHRLPELRPVPAPHRREERGVRPPVPGRLEGRDARSGSARSLELVRLTGFEKRRPSQLSGGQQQRVALARALILNPARPPARRAARAPSTRSSARRLQIELKAIQEEVGITFIYVTHDQEEALTMSDRHRGDVARARRAGRAAAGGLRGARRPPTSRTSSACRT